MITVNIICTGSLKEKYLREAVGEYSKRLTRYCNLNIIELPEEKLPQNPSQSLIDRALEKEGEHILQKCGKSTVIALCIEGRQWTSREFADKLSELASNGVSEISFVIGSSYGIADSVKKKASYRMSVSKMTFPHQLFRVMLLEQTYRAFNILSDGKYHK